MSLQIVKDDGSLIEIVFTNSCQQREFEVTGQALKAFIKPFKATSK